jgi:hypothetical protein
LILGNIAPCGDLSRKGASRTSGAANFAATPVPIALTKLAPTQVGEDGIHYLRMSFRQLFDALDHAFPPGFCDMVEQPRSRKTLLQR